MDIRDLLDILMKYCTEIRHNRKHYICYLKDGKNMVIISATASDRYYYREVYRDFRRHGVIIKEIKY